MPTQISCICCKSFWNKYCLCTYRCAGVWTHSLLWLPQAEALHEVLGDVSLLDEHVDELQDRGGGGGGQTVCDDDALRDGRPGRITPGLAGGLCTPPAERGRGGALPIRAVGFCPKIKSPFVSVKTPFSIWFFHSFGAKEYIFFSGSSLFCPVQG